MKIVYITAGAGRKECDACLRDGNLAGAIRRHGHEVLFVPTYTPIPAAARAHAVDEIFYGGINVYLQKAFPLFQKTPRFIDALFDRPWLLDLVARFGHMTQARDLAELTISVLEGERGAQHKELDRLAGWLGSRIKPDAIVLPNSMLAGLAQALGERLGAPVFCLLSGEDAFIENFPEPHRSRTLEVLRRRAAGVDGFLATNRYYADFMARYLAVDPRRVHVITPGVDLSAYPDEDRARPKIFTIGYRFTICEANGLHLLVEAFRRLKAEPETAACRLHVAGYVWPADRPYFKSLLGRIKAAGLEDDFHFFGELDPAGRVPFLRGLSVFSVPTVYPEALGMYVPEALAAGVPVVLSSQGCHPEWIESTQGGVLVKPGDADELAAALARLMRDRDLALRHGREGRRVVHERHTVDYMAASFLDALARK